MLVFQSFPFSFHLLSSAMVFADHKNSIYKIVKYTKSNRLMGNFPSVYIRETCQIGVKIILFPCCFWHHKIRHCTLFTLVDSVAVFFHIFLVLDPLYYFTEIMISQNTSLNPVISAQKKISAHSIYSHSQVSIMPWHNRLCLVSIHNWLLWTLHCLLFLIGHFSGFLCLFSQSFSISLHLYLYLGHSVIFAELWSTTNNNRNSDS